MRLIISLFILLAASTSLSFTVEYPGAYEATAQVEIFGQVMVPLPYGTSTTDNLEVVTWYPVEFWAEPFSLDYDVSVTNAYTYTNIYDQVYAINQTTISRGVNVGYTILSQRENAEVAESFELPANVTNIGNRIFYNKTATPTMIRFNPDPVDRTANGTLVWRTFKGLSFSGYTDSFPTNEIGGGDYITSFSGLTLNTSLNCEWSESVIWTEIGNDTGTLRYAMSGVIISNSTPSDRSYFKIEDATGLNPVTALVSATSNLVADVITASMTYTNASDYALFNGAYQTNDAVILEGNDYVRWTIPAGVLESNKTYFVNFNMFDREYSDVDNPAALTVRINGADLTSKSGPGFFQSNGAEALVDVRIYSDGVSADRFRIKKLEFIRPDSRLFVYSTENHATSTYIRNTNCWAASLDLTPCSPWNDSTGTIQGGTLRAGTLVSRDCMLNATHYGLTVGTTVRFVAADNSAHERLIIAKRDLVFDVTDPRYDLLDRADISVYRFASELPSSITHCKVWPANYYEYIPATPGIAGVRLNQAEMVMATVSGISHDRVILTSSDSSAWPSDNAFALNWRNAIVGDSGNPTLEFVGTEPVLVFTHWLVYWGPFVSKWNDDINAAMTDMGSIYQLDPVDIPALGFSKLGNIGEAP